MKTQMRELRRLVKECERLNTELTITKLELTATKESIILKDQAIFKLQDKSFKLTDKLQFFKDRYLNANKKIKVLQAKSLNDVGFKSITERRQSQKTPADWFELYAVEKSKNERILANLQRCKVFIYYDLS